jgi:hypothetical protein
MKSPGSAGFWLKKTSYLAALNLMHLKYCSILLPAG